VAGSEPGTRGSSLHVVTLASFLHSASWRRGGEKKEERGLGWLIDAVRLCEGIRLCT